MSSIGIGDCYIPKAHDVRYNLDDVHSALLYRLGKHCISSQQLA